MKNRGFFWLFVSFIIFIFSPQVYGLNTVTLTEGQSIFVDISMRNLNLVKFPFSGARVYTGSKLLDIKVDEGNIFIKFIENEPPSPQEVFFIVSSGVYPIILVPKEIPAQTIIVRLPREEISEALNWEASHSYIAGLKELIKAMYEERPPRGFSVKLVGEERIGWKEAKVVLRQVYTGATIQGEVYEITNISKELARFIEKEFYEKGILAVSLDRHELKPGEKTELYLVKKTKTQREFERIMRKDNPLDVLRGER